VIHAENVQINNQIAAPEVKEDKIKVLRRLAGEKDV
jgi:hypothetical protein